MASRGVSVLKFVGTVSLGLLTIIIAVTANHFTRLTSTGLSYTLSTLTVPTLLTLPSASTAAKAFYTLASTARTHLRALAGVSSTAFLLAFFLSPRPYRHPYLLYTSFLVFTSRAAVADFVAPYLFASPETSAGKQPSAAAKQRREQRSRARMEMSYDVIGSEAHSDATDSASDKDLAETEDEHQQHLNGEDVRGEVEVFLKKQITSTALAGLGFLMAVVGIWGDGVAGYLSETVVIEV